MAAPVWLLTVDLQTKTASFTTGLADAARGAKSSFKDISDGAKDMGDGVEKGGLNVRAAIGLVDNTIRGAHAMAMADMVREFQNTRIVMAALPFAVTVAGFAAVAGIVVEVAQKIKEYREEKEKLATAETQFGTTVRESFNGLDDRILQAGKHADELRNDHLGALRKELELIDHTSMADLVKEFDVIAKAADEVFKHLEGHWYTFGIGSAGASHALDQFKTKYDSLLAQGKDKEASDLLTGTLSSAQEVLKYQQELQSLNGKRGSRGAAEEEALNAARTGLALKGAGVGFTEKEVAAQQALVSGLQGQVAAQAKIEQLKGIDKGNANRQYGNEESAKASEAARQAAAARLAIAEQQLAGERAIADARLEINRASVAERLQSDLAFAQRDLDIKLAANNAERAALDKAGKDYANQLKESQNKAEELVATHLAQVAQLRSQAEVAQNAKDIADLEGNQRALIAGTQQGSAARLAAIDAALTTAEQRNLQETDFYRSLLTQRVEVVRQKLDEENRLKAEAGKEAADNALKMGQLELAAQLEAQAVADSSRRLHDADIIAEQLAQSQREFEIKQQALQREQLALDQNGKDYDNKLKALQDKELQLIREHENQKTAIKDQAEKNRNARILGAEQTFNDSVARELTQSLMGHQSYAAAMTSLGNEVASGMLRNAIKSVLANDYSRESDAAAAARQMFLAGMHLPFPANIVAAPILAAGAFASVMAYSTGTDSVPGVGRGDVTPAMLTPGEGVVPGGVMDGLRTVARNGGFDQKPSTTVHLSPVYHVQTIDGDGMQDALNKHTKVLQRHVEQTVRKMNR